MILQCPQCESRFVLPAKALMPEGRKVKCSSCAHMWHQLPDMEEIKSLEQLPSVDIPAAVKPLPEGSNVPVIQEQPETKFWQDARFGGYAAAFAVFLLLLMPVMAFFSSEEVDYNALSMKNVSIRVVDSTDTEETLRFEGTLKNVSEKAMKVPHFRYQLLDASDRVLEEWDAPPFVDEIQAGEEVTTSFPHTTKARGAEELRLKFIAAKDSKTASEGDGNIPAPLPADPHPTAHGADQESPAPAAAH